jgi:cyclase
VVLSMDVKRVDGGFRVFAKGGRVDTGIDALTWARDGQARGAGEIVLNSIDADGVKGGFDLEMLNAIASVTSIPLIASGGAGNIGHFLDLFTACPRVDAGLAASIFHRKEVAIEDLKNAMAARGIPARRLIHV